MKSLLSLLALAVTLGSASGWSGPIQSPELHASASLEGTKLETYKKIDAYMRTKMTFLDGRFFGAQSKTWRHGGALKNARTCVEMMCDSKLWEPTVIAKPAKDKKEILTVHQRGIGGVTLLINSAHPDYRAADFEHLITDKLPVKAVAPKAKEAAVEKDNTLEQMKALIMGPKVAGSAAEKGKALARQDATAKRMRILGYGKPSAVMIDEASGLPRVAVAGCVVSSSFVEAAEAYNTTMRELAAKK